MHAHLVFREKDRKPENVFTTFFGNEALLLPIIFPDFTFKITVQDSTIVFNEFGSAYSGLLGRGEQSSLQQRYTFADALLTNKFKYWNPKRISRPERIIWSTKPTANGIWHVLCWLPIDNQVRLTMLDSIKELVKDLYS